MKEQITEWTQVGTATNGTATATQSAPTANTGNRLYVTWFTVSFSAAPAAAVTFKIIEDVGGTPVTKLQVEIPSAATAPVMFNLVKPIRFSEAKTASGQVGAAGSGVVGTVTLGGYTASS